MKKLITISLMAIALLGINSCAKKGCTDKSAPNYDPPAKSDDGTCKDLTASIVGSYNGAYEDSTIDGSLPTLNSANVPITITKVDDSHIQVISPSGSGFDATFTASVSLLANGNYHFSVPAQTVGGLTITPYLATAGCSYAPATRTLGMVVIAGGTDIEAFLGTH